MSRRNDRRHSRRKSRSGGSESERGNIIQTFLKMLREHMMKGVILFAGAALLFGVQYFGGEKVLRKLRLLKTQVETTQIVRFTGECYQLIDQKASPMDSIRVVVKGFDAETGMTDENGKFILDARLPNEYEGKMVTLRFLDEDNNLIFEAVAAVIIDNKETDKPIRYVHYEEVDEENSPVSI